MRRLLGVSLCEHLTPRSMPRQWRLLRAEHLGRSLQDHPPRSVTPPGARQRVTLSLLTPLGELALLDKTRASVCCLGCRRDALFVVLDGVFSACCSRRALTPAATRRIASAVCLAPVSVRSKPVMTASRMAMSVTRTAGGPNSSTASRWLVVRLTSKNRRALFAIARCRRRGHGR